METKWENLVTADVQVKELETKMLEIDDVINHHVENINDPGLFTGLSGILLHKTIMWKYFGDEKYYVESEKLLTRIFDIIESREINECSYCSGLAGIGLVLQHVTKNDIFDLAYEDILNEFNPHILAALDQCLENNFYDFLYGGTGLGIYLVETGIDDQHNASIEALINGIESASVLEPTGRRLDQPEPYEPAFTGCNFGLAHGLPAVLVFLTKAYRKGILPQKTKQLAGEFATFLLNNRNTDATAISIFPNFITGHPAHQDRYSRLAWCYGDLGVCSALLQYATAFNEKEVFDSVVSIMKNTAMRTQQSEPVPISDPFFCHGGGGLSHIFNRAFHYTRANELQVAAASWVKETMNYLNDPEYMNSLTLDTGKVDFLNGISGTSLSLAATITDNDPNWDKFFLLS